MNIHALSRHVHVIQHIPPASYTTEENGVSLDMNGYDGVLFILEIGLIAATGVLNADIETAVDTGFTIPATLTGGSITALAATDDDITICIDVHGRFGLTNRFIRMELTPSVAAAIAGVTAIQYRNREVPADVTDLEELLEVTIADVDADPGVA